MRGIGVALINSVSASRPLAASARRCSTPKRCCSSMTTSARSRNSTSGCNSACVPTTTGVSPEARLASIESRARPFSRPVRKPISTPAAAARRCKRRVMLAGQDLGRRHQRRLTAALDRDQHRQQRDDGLAAADIALQQAHHAARRAMSAAISASAWRWRRSARSRARLRPAPASAPVPDERPALLPPPARAHQRHRELAGQDLVIGEALARRAGGREIGFGALRRMDDCGPPRASRPDAALAQAPGRSIRAAPARARRRAVDRPLHDPRRQAGGQRVDRLDRLQPVELVGPQRRRSGWAICGMPP